jgi:hypothetical protein
MIEIILDLVQSFFILYLLYRWSFVADQLSDIKAKISVQIPIDSDQNYLLQRYKDEVQNRRFSKR